MIEIKGKKIVLIGGAGFIGHNIALKLKELGADVSVVDNLLVNNYYSFKEKEHTSPEAGLYINMVQQRLDLLRDKKINLVKVDAREYDKLSIAIGALNPDVIIHLAAVAHADRSNKDPFSTFDHSLRTLENALDIARSPELSVKHFIYFSSSMIYGNFPNGSVTEETPCQPIGIYGALKFAGEKMVVAYNQVFNLPYTIVRPSALYGERCVSRRVGQIFIESALKGEDINIKGDGSDKLDFTYVGDLVQGIVKTIQSEKSKGEIFNLTYGEARSIAQMSDIIKQHFPKAKVIFQPRDKLMPSRGTLDVDKARKLIGYDPQFPLEKGYVEYINWYKSAWTDLTKKR